MLILSSKLSQSWVLWATLAHWVGWGLRCWDPAGAAREGTACGTPGDTSQAAGQASSLRAKPPDQMRGCNTNPANVLEVTSTCLSISPLTSRPWAVLDAPAQERQGIRFVLVAQAGFLSHLAVPASQQERQDRWPRARLWDTEGCFLQVHLGKGQVSTGWACAASNFGERITTVHNHALRGGPSPGTLGQRPRVEPGAPGDRDRGQGAELHLRDAVPGRPRRPQGGGLRGGMELVTQVERNIFLQGLASQQSTGGCDSIPGLRGQSTTHWA